MLENTQLTLTLSMKVLLHSERGEDDGDYSDYNPLNVFMACECAWKKSKIGGFTLNVAQIKKE